VLNQALGSTGAGEYELAQALTKRGWTFTRQQRIKQPTVNSGRYWFVDFAWWKSDDEPGLIVELTWHNVDPLEESRRRRTLHLLDLGWHVLFVTVDSPVLRLFEAAADVVALHAQSIKRGKNVRRLVVARAVMSHGHEGWHPVVTIRDPWRV
jgi:hypothetical protein